MAGVRLAALDRVAAEMARRWPGSKVEAVKIGRRKITLVSRINGVRVKAVINPLSGRIRVFSPLTGVNITLTRIIERWLIGAEKPVQEEA
jgi:hypothetical protein